MSAGSQNLPGGLQPSQKKWCAIFFSPGAGYPPSLYPIWHILIFGPPCIKAFRSCFIPCTATLGDLLLTGARGPGPTTSYGDWSNTEEAFQDALATYTKAGNKTAAMRRLWNTAYKIGRAAAEEATRGALKVEMGKAEQASKATSRRVEEVKKIGFIEGREVGFEEGRESAMNADAFAVSFSAGKQAGVATGIKMGREMEEQRWKDAGHFADETTVLTRETTALTRDPGDHNYSAVLRKAGPCHTIYTTNPPSCKAFRIPGRWTLVII
ncbi:hypothetical protein B0H17DRAFT_1138615 [Mycena rosella]|uniref:Uncharacterized protein n=1 Tax=Mycena rosella TaxID=1033263 RepID=A0AAD7GE85_MYCRO|nr:hypothetical protein B0H17DRAFT_1138615 [Mycena rosella]